MGKPNFEKIYQWAITAIIGVILEVVVIDLGNLQGYCTSLGIPCQAIYIGTGAFSLLASIALVQLAWSIIPKIYSKVIFFLKIPSPKNLRLLPFLLPHNNEYNLIFFPTEWRYPFEKLLVYPSVPSLGEKIFLNWRNSSPEKIKMWQFSEINFIKLDTENNEFSLRTDQGESVKYKPGKYMFKVLITCNILNSWNSGWIKNGFKTTWHELYVVVDFKGQRKFSIKLQDSYIAV